MLNQFTERKLRGRTLRRNQPNCKINWRFTTEDARIKLKKLYPSFEH